VPRYFFNLRSQEGLEIDIDGLKLESLHAALDEASYAAEAAIALSPEAVVGCFEIEDEGRVVVARVPYAAEPYAGEDAEKIEGDTP
jgi:hypothetical protein